MDNKAISKIFKLCSQLMELHNENPFRTKSIASASFKLDKLPFRIDEASLEDLSAQPGIGKSTAEKAKEVAATGTFKELEELIENTPAGIIEMLNIKGLGPKKIQIIWKELEIESVGELLYACNENRLVEAKGFGLKTQEDIKKSIEFSISNKGWFLYAKVLPLAEKFFNELKLHFPSSLLSYTGDFRRKCEVLSTVDLLISESIDNVEKFLDGLTLVEKTENSIELTDELGFTFKVFSSNINDFYRDLILSTGSTAHLDLLFNILPDLPSLSSEEAIYRNLGLDYIEPELREGLDEIVQAQTHSLPKLIQYKDLRGTLHNHSTYSDGVHSLEQMALHCKDVLGLEYLGICDHSRTAVYANGLSIERLEQQWNEIATLNEKLAPFKIFRGIESDILGDGSLDYPDEVLAKFDFVVASVHSNLKMDEDKATTRLIKAIENPYTTILGHPTGRLLLSRAGYPLDFKRVIDACAANGVVIEINANPLRLDLDWRWHRYAVEKGVLLSINPDAHRTEGLHDMQYGVLVAQKGGLQASNCLNAYALDAITTYFNKKKQG
ncbi:DNA polymerase/3'-5' exonuclease PolX [Sphingobacterium paramultivorum]|uniref:DNA-directed DNA polymerase n=1 Tax=Sphingobacterium paramultivorum TaxID=2886510 RepID=A0A7G5E354_9SPHI|nr:MULTISPECIES: DNA polymerase/3'-5' exonuclease PolX [Sphingobacterium]MCS4165911.1 DNA polymerase (family 10) [Sphingobacterium sp. BIGb0116]QMV68429.1 DNA polymerase/3'-5' exonuclease PolX [Sphingobacterium paramultivorum]WET69377.1 MAG: helix-hairpin-helix domain-containing protein [Sphingobacterium sp.]WSO17364.1 helix-hairpin-helix domain-containing protein [Sphingobacterium paramultivorum]